MNTRRAIFYISNHGFGHASRNIPIIQALLEADDCLELYIKTQQRQLAFIKDNLSQYIGRVTFIEEDVDVGLVLKDGSQQVDRRRLQTALERYIETWPRRAQQEAEFLENHNIALVVSDIVPWAFKAARLAQKPSLLISNFGWHEIYTALGFREIVTRFLQQYETADTIFEYPLAMGFNFHENVHKVGMSCRRFSNASSRIAESFKQPMVFVSLGRSVELPDVINVESLPYAFVYTAGLKLAGDNTHELPEGTPNTHDYIKASRLVITKAGWSTVAEAICARKPMLLLERPEISEDAQTVSRLVELGIADRMSFEQLLAGDLESKINGALLLEREYTLIDERYRDHASDIAHELLKLLYKG